MKPMPNKQRITHTRLLEVVNYDPDTGVFTNRIKRRGSKGGIGKVLGTKNGDGYIILQVDYVDYRAHVLAWFYVNGKWPESQLDHRDGVRHNNAIGNLREATNSQNQANAKMFSTNTVGYKGVYRHRDKFRAMIHVDGKRMSLGSFTYPSQAHEVYAEAARKYRGEFARLS